jgi:spectinomycin phosphotransferase
MDTPPPREFDDEVLGRAVTETWGLPVDEFRYLPKGAGSYHWVAITAGAPTAFLTVDDLDTKPWIADHRDAAFRGLAAAFGAAWALEHEGGLSFAVAPLRSRSESVVLRLSDQYSLAVFPFVEGTPGTWGDPLEPAARDALARQLTELHGALTPSELGLSRRPYAVPERPALMQALDELDNAWEAGPLSEPARQALAAHAADVVGWLGELDALADHLRQADVDPVVTHGEPHPGNLIRTDAGLRLIDWDTVAPARPERDLWMLEDGTPGCVRLLEERTGHAVSNPAMTFYRLAWTLSDIASFVDMFRSPHQQTQWLDRKFTGLQRLLAGESSAPYSHPQRELRREPRLATGRSASPLSSTFTNNCRSWQTIDSQDNTKPGAHRAPDEGR